MNQTGILSASAAALAAALGAGSAQAQTSPLIIDRGRIDRTQDQPAPPPKIDVLRGSLSVEDDIAPTPSNSADGSSATQSNPEKTQPRLTLNRVRIQGSSLPEANLSSAWSDKIGAPLERSLIEEIAAALSALYKKSDIALYTILARAQNLNGGEASFTIIEGHISDVIIQTDDKDSRELGLVRAYAEKLTREKPLRRVTLERYLSLIRDIPGEKIEAQLIPSSQRGGARLILTAKRNRLDFGFGLNNRGTPLLGRTQASVDLAYNGLLRAGDQTSLSLAAPASEDLFTYAAFAHSTPLGANGLRLSVSASALETRLKSGVDGDAQTAGVALSYPLIRSYERNASASLGFDALNSSNAAFGQVLDSSKTRTLRAGLSYGRTTAKASFGASASLSLGLDAFGAKMNPYFSQPDFSKFGLQAGWDRLWAQRYALRLRIAGQASGDMLPASEQMALGGDAFGRAYQGAIVQGDQAIAGSAEAGLRFNSLLPSWMSGSETYAFADAGQVWLKQRPLWPSSDFALSSAGFGARLAIGKKTTLGLEFAHGLKAPYPAAEGDWRFVYSLISRH